MIDSQKFVLLLQTDRFQGRLWRTVLDAQKISVIWEPADTDLRANLVQMEQAQMLLPHVLILDVHCLGDNPYVFCRWCKEFYPAIKILLTNHTRQEVSQPERDWAIYQGAADLVLGFQQTNFVGSAILCVRRVFELLDQDDMNGALLIPVLLKLEQDYSTQAADTTLANGHGVDHATTNQHPLPQQKWRGRPVVTPTQNGQSPNHTPSKEQSGEATQPKVRRRYRGAWY